jgi:hypothetical protein
MKFGGIKMFKMNSKKENVKTTENKDRANDILMYTLDQIKDEATYILNSDNEEVNHALIENILKSAERALDSVTPRGLREA